MTLDEAIAKAKADGDVQLAEWLRQARGADAAARWYTEKLRDAHRTIRKLLNENSKLRELVADMMQAWWACDNEVCPRHDERCEKGKYCAFDECAQELGIEVG